jgi:hypothetical protein
MFERDQHAVSRDDSKRYFETLAGQIKSIPPTFIWDAEETPVGCPADASPLEVIVASNARSDSAAVPEKRDDAQAILLIGISALGYSTFPFSNSKHSR